MLDKYHIALDGSWEVTSIALLRSLIASVCTLLPYSHHSGNGAITDRKL